MVARFLNSKLCQDVITGKVPPEIPTLSFRDPDSFVAGGLHKHADTWSKIAITSNYEHASEVLDWITSYISVHKFFKPFKGNFNGKYYDSNIPPSVTLDKNKTCKQF